MGSRPTSLQWFDRLSFPLEIGATAVGLVMVWYFTDISTAGLGGAAIGIGAARLWQPTKRRFGINTGWGKAPVGFALFGMGVYSFTYPEGLFVIKLAFVLVGGWITLDGLYDLRSGVGETVAGSPNTMERFGDAHIVGRAIESDPQSLDELTSNVDLPRHRIQKALEMLVNADVITERDGRYHTQCADRTIGDTLKNAPSRATERVGSIPDRVLRPFRLFGFGRKKP